MQTPSRWRQPSTALAAGAAALVLLVAACGAPPAKPPGRVAPPLEREQEGTSAPAAELPRSAIAPYDEDPLFEPVREALARGDWVGATLSLPQAGDPAGEDPLADWRLYFSARIALARGDLAGYQAQLAALANPPPSLARELLRHQLQQAQLAGDHKASADYALALLRAGGHPALSLEQAEGALWRAVQSIPEARASAQPWSSWWLLARAAGRPSGRAAVAALEAWLGQHPGHPAQARAEQLLGAALADAQVESLALLAPLSGPLESAGAAIADGMFAAWFAQDRAGARVDVLDSRRFERVTDAREQALSQGADVVLGPLGKREVAELLATAPTGAPLITLNRPEDGAMLPTVANNALQLSLAPEDEAQQIARRAYAAGGRRALIVRPEGEWGARMETALLGSWTDVGGQVTARAVYGNTSTRSRVLEEALHLDRSASRSREIRQLFNETPESQGRRRQDLDVIFLLAKSAEEARSLKPLINYHYAGNLPVYAPSTADDGRDEVAANRDLEGLRLPVMPWRIAARPPGLDGDGTSFAALHALGVDAYRLASLSHRLTSGVALRFRGFTGDLGVASDGTLLRELPMAEFDDGVLVPR